jgi:hypothetical protein
MSSFDNKSPRLILRFPADAEEQVERYASSFGWDRVKETEDDPEAGMLREVTWSISSGVDLNYSIDDATGCAYVFVTAALRNQCQAFHKHAEQHLNVFSREELLEFHDGAESVEERAGALLMLALGSPQEFDEDGIERITRALRDPAGDLREAAVHATVYTPAPQYVPLLRGIASHDPVPDIREDAKNMLAAYEEAGIGDS